MESDKGPPPENLGEGLGLVMGGGGARAAYQVGFLRCLSRRYPDLNIPYISGLSAGAINAAHLASHHGSFGQAVEELSGLWSNLTVDDVFRTDIPSLMWSVARWLFQLGTGGVAGGSGIRALADTAPLRRFLEEALASVDGEITGIEYNLRLQRLRAIALSTSSYSTGQSVTWVQGDHIEEWERPHRRSQNCVLTVDHVMASAAIPLFFPAVKLGSAWYGDGGLRLSAPLSPVLHMGARRVLAISTRYASTEAEAAAPVIEGYPPPAQVVGVLLNTIFLDLLDQDVLQLERFNRLLTHLPPEQHEGLHPIRLMVLRPSVDLGRLAQQYEAGLPKGFRFLTRGLGTRQTRSPDFLSLILFQSEYLKRLIDIGEADADARAGELEEFMEA